MSQRHSFSVVAGVATVMASFPLTMIFKTYTWLVYAAFAVIVVVGVAMLVRTARGPVWTQVLAMMGALLVFLTAVFPSGHEFLRLVPTVSTFTHFNDLLALAGEQVRSEAVPVPDHADGALLLLTTMSIGLVAILIDFVAVGLRRPALAGLPMLAIYSVPVAVIPGNINFLVFLVPAIGYLWLLITDSVDRVRRFGRRFTGEGRDVELWEPSPLSSAGRRLGVVGIIAAIVLPLAIPNMSAGILQRFNGPGSGPGLGTGTGPVVTAVDLNALLVQDLHLDQAFDMVYVQTNDPDPGYLRFGVADQLKKDGFANISPSSGDPLSDPIDAPALPNIEGITGTKYTATIKPVGFNMALAPVFRELTAITGLNEAWSYDTSTDQVFARNTVVQDRMYNIEYVHVNYTVAALRKAGPIRRDDPGLRSLSNGITEPSIQELVRGLIAGKTTEYDQVRALYDYFGPGNGFQYSLTAPAGNSGNALVDFLNQKKGFCVQYATALAMLVRTAGIPARVAFGFTRGTKIKQDGFVHLTNLNLHAWTEVFFPNIGWVPFDATPADSVTGSNPTVWAPNLANPSSTDDNAPDPNAPKETGGPGGIQPEPQPTGGGAGGVTSAIANPWLIGGALLLVVILVALVAPAVQRRTLRHRRRSRTGPQPDSGVMVAVPDVDLPHGPGLVQDPAVVAAARADAHAAWEELIDTMVDFDVPVDPSETPRATASRLSALPAFGRDAQDASAVLARAEERARYARMPLQSDRLNASLLTVRGALIERATRRQRLLAMFMPRSVTNRWRSDWIALVNQGIRTAAQFRDRVSVIDPRRILASRAR